MKCEICDHITPVWWLPNPKLSYLLSEMLPASLISHLWAVSDGKIPASGGSWVLMKHYKVLHRWMLKEQTQKAVYWIGEFLTQGYFLSNGLRMRRGAFLPLWDGVYIDWRWALLLSLTLFFIQNWLDVTDIEISRNDECFKRGLCCIQYLMHLWIYKCNFTFL